jgi:hypothetical protein
MLADSLNSSESILHSPWKRTSMKIETNGILTLTGKIFRPHAVPQ